MTIHQQPQSDRAGIQKLVTAVAPTTTTDMQNERRKQKYHSDETYRLTLQARSREAYRDTQGGIELRDASVNIPTLDSYGEVREVTNKGYKNVPDKVMCFTAHELAEALDGYTGQAVYRWIRKGQLPPMTTLAMVALPTKGGTIADREVRVYTKDEAREIIRVLSEHQQNFSYYTGRHKETAEKLFSVVSSVRGE